MIAMVQRTLGATSLRYSDYDGHFDGPGLVVLLGWEKSDESHEDLDAAEEWIYSRVVGLRIFLGCRRKNEFEFGRLRQTVGSQRAGILWVSQFTLTAELVSGFRPSFTRSMAPEMARTRYATFLAKVRNHNPESLKVFCGAFAADMNLTFTNWGPVTIPLRA